MPQDYKSAAQAILGRHTTTIPIIGKAVYVNTETLGTDLAVQSLSYLLAVCQVFDLLSSSYDRAFTSYYFIKNTSDAVLMRIARYKQGNALLVSINRWVGQEKLANGGNWVGEFKIVEDRIYTARRQAGQLINYDPHEIRQLYDYEIPVGGNKEIRYELPAEGANYVVYNRNDVRKDGLDQFGTLETIKAIWKIAEVWKSKGTGAYFEVGDISRAGGLNTSAHDTHEDGKAFDMRPMRNDGGVSTKPFTWKEIPPYHRDWTKAFIRMVRQLYPGTLFYFNDPDIFQDPEFRGIVIQYGEENSPEAHDNHIHIILPGGERGKKEKGN